MSAVSPRYSNQIAEVLHFLESANNESRKQRKPDAAVYQKALSRAEQVVVQKIAGYRATQNELQNLLPRMSGFGSSPDVHPDTQAYFGTAE